MVIKKISDEKSAPKKFVAVEYKTMATPSFNTDSPKTLAFKLWSTFNPLKMDKIVTGSVDEIKPPKHWICK